MIIGFWTLQWLVFSSILIFIGVPILQAYILRLDTLVIKPFTCRKCLSFWISLYLHSSITLALQDWVYFIWSLLFTVGIFIILQLNDTRR